MFRNLQPLFYGPMANVPSSFLVILFVWSFFWKGITLWRAARNNQKYWYIVLLTVNTLGILEIVYLAFFQRARPETKLKVQSAKEKASK